MRSALWLPPFDPLADPLVIARLAAEAEEAGWHGMFVWDHLLWREPVQHVADPWIVMAAIATATERLRLGPMVSPLPRRRPAKLARETASLDLLSGGRLTLGVGIGSDRFAGELSMSGEELDDRLRGEMLDESLSILTAAWSGEPVHHRGQHYVVDGARFLPRPVQRPGVPVWVAGFPGNAKPLRRAARHQGFFPVNLESPDQLAEVVEKVTRLRSEAGASDPYDFAMALAPGTDAAPYADAGATWWLTAFPPGALSLDRVRGVLRDGPLPVAESPTRATISSYEKSARDYAMEIDPLPPDFRAAALRRLVEAVGEGGTVLEVGSGTGRDADYLESLGATVRRTDATKAFADIQAERGKRVEPLDVVSDELGGPYDGVLAICVLIHVERRLVDAVLEKVAAALRPGGAFLVTIREGAGETMDRTLMVFWSASEFAARLSAAGLEVEWDELAVDSDGDSCLTFLARKPE